MTIREFYSSINEDYNQMKQRFSSDKKIKKFIMMFANDESMEKLLKACEINDKEMILTYLHTLKGVAANLNFTKLYLLSGLCVEELKSNKDISPSISNIKVEYSNILKNLATVK